MVKPKHPMVLNTGTKIYKIEQKSLSKEGLHGCVEFMKGTLSIDPNQSPEDYKNTLIHEICHIGYEMFGLGSDEEMGKTTNEFITTVTANMLHLFSTLNPELFEYMFSESK